MPKHDSKELQKVCYESPIPEGYRDQRIKELRDRGYTLLWGTSDGKIIPVTLLTYSHLRNAINYVRRQVQSTFEDQSGNWKQRLDDFYHQYDMLIVLDKELKRRDVSPWYVIPSEWGDLMDEALRELDFDEMDIFRSVAIWLRHMDRQRW